MGTGWRRAFCNSVTDHNHGSVEKMKLKCNKQYHHEREGEEATDDPNPIPTPRSRGKLGFFSNPSTPRLSCRTTTTSTINHDKYSGASTPTSGKHSPRVGLALMRALRLSRIGCGICMAGVKTGQGTAVFTAECGHAFHFPCIAGHARSQTGHLSCPVCSTPWLHAPLLAVPDQEKYSDNNIYADDEPLNDKIVEESGEDAGEFKGFFVDQADVVAELLQEVAVVDISGRDHRYVVAMRIKAQPARGSCRAAVDLVVVLDVGGSPIDTKLAMLKKAARLVVNSLGPADRLSLVFPGGRLLPLRRMTLQGRLAALKYVDELLPFNTVTNIPAVLDRAAKVLQHRRERNPVATIMLISNGVAPVENLHHHQQQQPAAGTRFAHVEIPSDAGDFTKCVGGLLSVVVRDLQLHLTFPSGEISGIYSTTNPPALMSGSGWVRLGDLYAEEEKELLLELRLPAAVAGAHHVLSVKFAHRSAPAPPYREQTLLIPRPHAGRTSERLRAAFVATRAAAKARRLAGGEDLDGAFQILSDARAALVQVGTKESLRMVETELSELHGRQHYQRRRVYWNPATVVDGDGAPFTPTSAWRAADDKAKLAQTKKSANRGKLRNTEPEFLHLLQALLY